MLAASVFIPYPKTGGGGGGRVQTWLSSGYRCTEMTSRPRASQRQAQLPVQVPGPSFPRHRLPSPLFENLKR